MCSANCCRQVSPFTSVSTAAGSELIDPQRCVRQCGHLRLAYKCLSSRLVSSRMKTNHRHHRYSTMLLQTLLDRRHKPKRPRDGCSTPALCVNRLQCGPDQRCLQAVFTAAQLAAAHACEDCRVESKNSEKPFDGAGVIWPCWCPCGLICGDDSRFHFR